MKMLQTLLSFKESPKHYDATDALAVASQTEGVLIVVQKNNTRLADINNMNEQLKYSGIEVVGSILIDF